MVTPGDRGWGWSLPCLKPMKGPYKEQTLIKKEGGECIRKTPNNACKTKAPFLPRAENWCSAEHTFRVADASKQFCAVGFFRPGCIVTAWDLVIPLPTECLLSGKAPEVADCNNSQSLSFCFTSSALAFSLLLSAHQRQIESSQHPQTCSDTNPHLPARSAWASVL